MEERIHILIARSLDNEATEAEKQELQEWLSGDPDHIRILEEVSAVWHHSGQVFDAMKKPDCRMAWSRICDRTRIGQTENTGRRINLPAWLKLAATAAMLAAGIFLFRAFSGRSEITVVAADDNKQVTLPDNTHISLRKGSKITYPKTFAAAERRVKLEGEAFFEVTHNERQPFIINAENARIKVLGTSFDVRCSKKAAFVTVVTGRVQFSDCSNQDKSLVLTPGEKGSLQENGLVKETANAGNYRYWETGELNFKDQPLAAIVRELGQVTQASVALDEKMPAEKQQQIVSIHFNHQTMEQMLNELCLITQCSWTKQNNTYLITSK